MINDIVSKARKGFADWSKEKFFQLIAINIILMVLVLLSTAGYFHPFFPLTITFVVLIGFILGAMIGVPSWFFFIAAALFWLLSGFFRLLPEEVWIWAERSSIYVFESLAVGSVKYILERRK